MNFKYTDQDIIDSAKKYTTIEEFRKNHNGQYQVAHKRGIFDDVSKHMTKKNKYTDSDIYNIALNCKSKKEFSEINNSAYSIAHQRGIIDNVCAHMIPLGNKYHRGIYSYELELNGVKYGYSGLCMNFKDRHKDHLRFIRDNKPNCGIEKFCVENNVNLPEMIIIYDYLPVEEAIIKEEENKLDLIKNGYKILNIHKCGSIGGSFSFTIEDITIEALKYSFKGEFAKCSPSHYNAAYRLKILDIVCSHMPKLRPMKQETKDKMSKTRKGKEIPAAKGRVAWNKGLKTKPLT